MRKWVVIYPFTHFFVLRKWKLFSSFEIHMGKVYVGKSGFTLSLGWDLTVKKRLLFKFFKKVSGSTMWVKWGLNLGGRGWEDLKVQRLCLELETDNEGLLLPSLEILMQQHLLTSVTKIQGERRILMTVARFLKAPLKLYTQASFLGWRPSWVMCSFLWSFLVWSHFF